MVAGFYCSAFVAGGGCLDAREYMRRYALTYMGSGAAPAASLAA